MIATQRDVRKYIVDNKLFENFKILGSKSGLSNCNYFLETDSGKYIFRTSLIRPNKINNSLLNEYNIYKYFEKKGFDFVPKTYYFDQVNNIHILSYIEGRRIRFRNISQKCMERVVKKLHMVNFLAQNYREYCEESGVLINNPKSEIERIRYRVLLKLQDLEEDNLFYYAKKWILDRISEDFDELDIDRSKVYLSHGDPADNIIVNKDAVSIIDWEHVHLTHSPGLVHILAHGYLAPEKQERLLMTYSKISGESLNELRVKTYTEKNMHYLLKLAKVCFEYKDVSNFSDEEISQTKKNIQNLMNIYDKLKFKIEEISC